VAIPWLAEKYRAEIVAVTLDLGQGKELDDVRERALAIGAARAHVIDAREEFARDYILPALQAGAIYEAQYPLATALGRPLIAKKLIEIANIEGTNAIAYGGIGKGSDQLRIEALARTLEPSIKVLAPARTWTLTRKEKITYARERGIPVPAAVDSPYSFDSNMWGRSIEGGVLEDPWQEAPEDIYLLTKSAAEAPDMPAYVEIGFEKGTPVRINGVEMSLVELISSLEIIAGVHGVGRVDMVENRIVGMKSREIYEAPAAVALHAAHKELRQFVTPRELERATSELAVKYADLVYDGLWFTSTRDAIDAFVRKVEENVTGVVRLKFFKGDCRVVGRKSPHALYDHALGTDDARDKFDQDAHAGAGKR
jgi:argininosuccinate synthase